MAEQKKPVTGDYDLSTPIDPNSTGLRQGLTSYGDAHFSLFLRKVFIKALGYSEDALSRPIIGIVNTYSSFNPCHANVPQLIEAVKRGVQLNGGLAIDFPTISIAESFASPTSMYLRNLMSMDTEEMIKAQPCDAVVLIGDCRNNWAAYRAGKIDIEDISAINDELAPTGGTCGVMGTASTMACILVGLGMMPFAGATAPAVSSARLRIAEQTGGLAVALHTKRLKPQDLLTRESFLNAITVLQAIGGSTNAVVHLMAIIGRHPAVAGTITLDTFDEIGRKTPLIVDLKPSGDNYMTDFHNSGGMLALLHEIKHLLYLDAMTVTGRTLGEELASTPFIPVPRDSLVNCLQPFSEPLYPASALAVLRGNIAPGGAVIKQSASKYRHLLKHSGPAVVFAGSADMALRIDDPDLDVTPDSVLVLQNIGPVGNPGMPEAGLIPIPRKLAAQGVQDMLRLSDGRMSGTAGGTIVLHISPEAADPESVLGIVRDGDIITFDAEQRVIRVEISDEEIKKRIAEKLQVLEQEEANGGSNAPWIAKKRIRGYRGLYLREVNQAEGGGDFDFLTARGPSRGL
ncbi:putative dehydratase IlvD1 [Colletotrichum sp. SAR11_240]|nr:putative dehydratase IlvD1 [Colletotrichum sp. SAR11_240]